MHHIENIEKSNLKKVILLVSLFTVLSSCSGVKINNDKNSSNISENTDAIVFLVFKMQQNDQKDNSIELISQTQVSGKMKAEPENAAEKENYLTIDLYQNNHLFKTIIKEHPLFKHVEYPDENNQYVSKNIEVKEDEFFFRIQKNGQPIEVRISETLKNNIKKELIDLKI
jgi:hypothetical protein